MMITVVYMNGTTKETQIIDNADDLIIVGRGASVSAKDIAEYAKQGKKVAVVNLERALYVQVGPGND